MHFNMFSIVANQEQTTHNTVAAFLKAKGFRYCTVLKEQQRVNQCMKGVKG